MKKDEKEMREEKEVIEKKEEKNEIREEKEENKVIEKKEKKEKEEEDKEYKDEKQKKENNKKQNEALMLLIGNISNLNDYLANQSKIKEVFAFFDKKYSFNENNIRNVSDILGFNIK